MRLLILIVLIPLVYIAAVLETSLADLARVGHVGPDLLAMLAIGWLLVVPGPQSFLTAGLVGLASDLISPGRIGVAAACFLLVGYGVTRLGARLPIKHVVWQVAVVWAAVSLTAIGVATGRSLLGELDLSVHVLLVRSLGVGVYTAGVSVPCLMVIGWLRGGVEGRGLRVEG